MKRILLLLAFYLLVKVAGAAVPVYRVLQIDPSDAELRVNVIFQDRDGFIWLGTDKGLWRYDGFRFDKALLDSTSESKQVFCIAQDAEGFLYAGLSDGGIIQNSKGWHRIRSPFSTPVNAIVFVAGKMWVASYGEGIAYREEREWRKIKTRDHSVYDMTANRSGKLFAGTDLGLVVIDANTTSVTEFSQQQGLPDNIVRAVFCSSDEAVVLGTEDKGICEFNFKTKTFTTPEVFADWNFGPVNGIALLPNEFWIGTSGKGIIDYEFSAERRVRSFNRENGFPFTTINAILNDRQGNLWISADNKLLLSPGERTEFITNVGTSLFHEVSAVATDALGYVWLSSANELFRYNNLDNTVTKWLTEKQYRDLHITSLAASDFGLWIGTFDNGLFLLDTVSGKVQRFAEKPGLLNPNVISIAAGDDSVWLATLGGISLATRDAKGGYVFTDFNREAVGRGFVYCVYRDNSGRIWFGTDGKGLVVYENGAFRRILIPGNKAKVIYSVVADNAGNIWFSTQQDGVYRYDGKRIKVFNTTSGLRANEISSLAIDKPGNILVIHTKGIDLIDPVNFTILPIGADAGIESIEPGLNAISRDMFGSVWIGTARGLLKFHNYDHPGSYEPLLHIKRVFSYLNPGSTERDTLFNYDENQISIEYAGLWYGNPESVKFQYRLLGYNLNWISTRDRIITFPNLPPGRYTFEVRATRNNTFLNAPFQKIHFVVNTPFWKRWWFIVLASLFILTVVYLVVKERTRRLRKLDLLEKERITYQYETLRSQVNPHFLFNSFNTLIGIIEDNQKQAAEFAGKLSDYFRNMVQYRDKEVISLAQEMELVQTYYYLQQQRFGEYLTITTTIPQEWLQLYGVPPLSLQLLIENAVKHNAVSFETPLHISVMGSGKDKLIVRNNLNPKTNPDRSTGIGLQNIMNRFRIISNHTVEVRKTDAYFEVELPLIKLAAHERIDR